jgi:drug/metabolite transporter (DMT)-like permease
MKPACPGSCRTSPYGIVLWAQTKAPLAEVAAIRETSVVFTALIGMAALGDGFGKRRVAGALVIAAGIVLTGISGCPLADSVRLR